MKFVGGLDSGGEPPHLLFAALVVKIGIFTNVLGVEEGAEWEEEYCVSSAMKMTLKKLVSGVGSLDI